MRTTTYVSCFILTACGQIRAADAPKLAPGPGPAPAVVSEPARTCTADDLSNLAAAARMAIKDLTPEQMVAIAVAIKHAQDDAAALRAAEAEVKAAAKPKEPAK